MAGVANGGDSGRCGLQDVVRLIAAYEPLEKAQNQASEAVSQLTRRARAQQFAQDQAQVERADMNQLPLQDILAPAQVTAPRLPVNYSIRCGVIASVRSIPSSIKVRSPKLPFIRR